MNYKELIQSLRSSYDYSEQRDKDAANAIEDLLECIEFLAEQFAYQTTYGGRPAYSTGGLYALENAFAVLGWEDPKPAPERECEADGCHNWATCGKPTADGYKHLCSEHFWEDCEWDK